MPRLLRAARARSIARSPDREKLEEIREADDAVVVQVRHAAAGAGSPGGHHEEHVAEADRPVLVEVPEARRLDDEHLVRDLIADKLQESAIVIMT